MSNEISPYNKFTRMQKSFYVEEATKWSPTNRDPVVGSFDAHNKHSDYDLLFEGLDTEGKIALDYGCGPGRNLVRYAPRFSRIDGADISLQCLIGARKWLLHNGIEGGKLLLVNGVDLREIKDETYDMVFSTICLQHVPVYEIRYNLMKEFYRVLKPGGWFTAQMGYGGTNSDRDAEYFDNRYDAPSTNGGCDVQVTNTDYPYDDLVKIGFIGSTFSAMIRSVGPYDRHANWIFFRSRK